MKENLEEKIRCLFCRKQICGVKQSFTWETTSISFKTWDEECLNSICKSLFKSQTHPYKYFLQKGGWCLSCQQIVWDLDFTLRTIQKLKLQREKLTNGILKAIYANYQNGVLLEKDPLEPGLESTTDFEYFDSSKNYMYDEAVEMIYDELESFDMFSNISSQEVEFPPEKCTLSDIEIKEEMMFEEIVAEDENDDFSEETTAKDENDDFSEETTAKDENDEFSEETTAKDENDEFSEEITAKDENDDFSEETTAKDENDDFSEEITAENENDDLSEETTAKDENDDTSEEITAENENDDLSKEIKYSNTDESNSLPERSAEENDDLEIPMEYRLEDPFTVEDCDDKDKTFCLDSDEYSEDGRKFRKKKSKRKPQERNVKCIDENCPEMFYYQSNMKDHYKKFHLGLPGKFHCSECDKRFFRKSELRRHMEDCHAPPPDFEHICQICSKGFDTVEELKSHCSKYHEGEKCENPFSCEDCDKVFTFSKELIRHVKEVHSVQHHLHMCSICGKGFKTKNKVVDHEKTVHAGVLGTRLKCRACDNDKTLETLELRRSHQKSVHSKSLHMLTHTGERPFICKICGAGFGRNNTLIMHERRHAGIRSFLCNLCGKGFTTDSGLGSHHKVHQRNPNYQPTKPKVTLHERHLAKKLKKV